MEKIEYSDFKIKELDSNMNSITTGSFQSTISTLNGRITQLEDSLKKLQDTNLNLIKMMEEFKSNCLKSAPSNYTNKRNVNNRLGTGNRNNPPKGQRGNLQNPPPIQTNLSDINVLEQSQNRQNSIAPEQKINKNTKKKIINKSKNLKNQMQKEIDNLFNSKMAQIKEWKDTKTLAHGQIIQSAIREDFNPDSLYLPTHETHNKLSAIKSDWVKIKAGKKLEAIKEVDLKFKTEKFFKSKDELLLNLKAKGQTNLDPDTGGVSILHYAQNLDLNFESNKDVNRAQVQCPLHLHNQTSHLAGECRTLRRINVAIKDENQTCFLHPASKHSTKDCLTLAQPCLHHDKKHTLKECGSFGVYLKCRAKKVTRR